MRISFPKFKSGRKADPVAVPASSPDPLDMRGRNSWPGSDGQKMSATKFLSADAFMDSRIEPTLELSENSAPRIIMDDVSSTKTAAMDDGQGRPIANAGLGGAYTVPEDLQNWFMSQSFPGYQVLALMSQQWLVDKACSMPAEDAVRHGWKLKVADEVEFSDEAQNEIKEWDKHHNLKGELSQFVRMNNIFGIRVAFFEVDSDDEKYYEKPFNIDGVTKGSYKGVSQVDPYWMMPMMTAESTSDPSSRFFYEPEYWIISGRKYHRSHLIIIRGSELPDFLKPTYIFGGISMVQRIYERVYAAERTANEAPLLATNKRTTAIHTNVEEVLMNESAFMERMAQWVRFRDNHAVKILGMDETMEQFDTSLADFDAIIMNQFQIVSAISRVPATKLLGTSPKGFNSTGEFEAKSYHEELESVQENKMSPLLDRHYLILTRSMGMDIELEVVWNPVASMTAKEIADLNAAQATARVAYATAGAVSADEIRTAIKDDPHGSFGRLDDIDANDDPGMTPENLAKLQTSGAANTKAKGALAAGQGTLASGEARAEVAGKHPDSSGGQGDTPPTDDVVSPTRSQIRPLYQPHQMTPEAPEGRRNVGEAPVAPKLANQPVTKYVEPGINQSTRNSHIAQGLRMLAEALETLHDTQIQEGVEPEFDAAGRSVRGSVIPRTQPRVAPRSRRIGKMDKARLPKMKVGGLIIPIENARGTIRSGQDSGGKAWNVTMPHHYGFIKGTTGADGDEMDCFVGPNKKAANVYVINQKGKDGLFDEHKCMMGFDNGEQAKQAYHQSYSPGWDGFGSMVEVPMPMFHNWLKSYQTQNPMSSEWLKGTTNSGELMNDSSHRGNNGQFKSKATGTP